MTGRAADVLLAAHHASEAALRLLRPGNEVIEDLKILFYAFSLNIFMDSNAIVCVIHLLFLGRNA